MKNLLTFILLLSLVSFTPADNVISRFKPSAGYKHIAVAPGSFGAYLQGLQLLPAGTHIKHIQVTLPVPIHTPPRLLI